MTLVKHAGPADWYKDAVVYEVHIKSFFDGNDDGIGDFVGLTRKLDYLQELGVTAIWVLPFYPSPLRDDGYDIANYRSVNPAYGTMLDFKNFIREAHARNMRVITELVVNHTSDQHAWFQRARRAPAGSNYRNWYVWSKTDQKFPETRIIFTDTEKSNWTWDSEANAFYWHRFFSHQPDLNFDNPQVIKAVLRTMQFWLDMGVDGFRLDAIPYLIEREGTINENLAETHTVIRKMRAELDKKYQNKLFLAEANQWPEDVQAYFGNGDECHMAYHFPLMPRMYMAIAQEDRHPITDIMRQTPEIPESCQWAIFLRNHDELTLEMVTDSERDYLWSTYAADKRARINVGIRRRLAPLMDNDRRKIELMNSLLMSMPGTPILYYGDEIGMGDNIYLGDRDGVRTPMQWTPDRNGGFSKADPARLFLPAIMDPIYGFQSVNVEAQSRSLASPLNWMRRLIAVRQQHKAFGRGTLSFLYPSNRSVFAYLRQYEDTTILCVANLSRTAQAVELELTGFEGRVPVELLGQTPFPIVRGGDYQVTLPPYGFYWFRLALAAEFDKVAGLPPRAPELVTVVTPTGITDLGTGRARATLERDVLPAWIRDRRWFQAKQVRRIEVALQMAVPFTANDITWLLTTVTVSGGGESHGYFVPLAGSLLAPNVQPATMQQATIAKTRRGPREGTLLDAAADENFARAFIAAVGAGIDLPDGEGRLSFAQTSAFDITPQPEHPAVRQLGGEQSNTSIMIEDYAVLKLYRRLSEGIHPELEMSRFLTEAGFTGTPALLGSLERLDADGNSTALAVLYAFVRNQGDGWTNALSYLDRFLEERRVLPAAEASPDGHAAYLIAVRQLATRTAEMHLALASRDDDPAFAPEPFVPADATALTGTLETDLAATFDALRGVRTSLSGEVAGLADAILSARASILEKVRAMIPDTLDLAKTRIHGDYHLGQVLVAQNDFYILDFEGQPSEAIERRRRKQVVLKDVAGMLRSFDYAAWTAYDRAIQTQGDRDGSLREAALAWRDAAVAAFIETYAEGVGGSRIWPFEPGAARRLLDAFLLEKALYEVRYEIANRPDWIAVPLRGVAALCDIQGDA